MFHSLRRVRRLGFAVLFAFAPVTLATAQLDEIEPNDSCPGAQFLGPAALPLALNGALDLPYPEPDIDFYRFIAPPGTRLQIDLRGASSESGSLGDPFLGVLDSMCNLLGMDDDAGNGTDSRIFVTMPPDGQLVLAATSCCDGGLTGEGGSRGTYIVVVDIVRAVASIRARLIDDETGDPLVGWWPTNAFAELWRCEDSFCIEPVSTQWADGEGWITFVSDYGGNPLPPGVYELRARAEAHEPATSGLFSALEDEAVDLGDVALRPYELIGSISGRIVDRLNGTALRGDANPWAAVQLQRCSNGECWEFVGSTNADADGRFVFDRYNTWSPLATGSYLLRLSADQYRPLELLVENVAADEQRSAGDIGLQPFPVQFGAVKPCVAVPAGGGSCSFSVEVRAGTRERLDAAAWSVVSASGTGSFLGHSLFQVGKQAGPSTVEWVKLRPGASKWVQFSFEVPDTVQAGAWICAGAFVGARPWPQFDTLGFRDLFCVVKEAEAFELVSEKDMRKQLERQRSLTLIEQSHRRRPR